MLTDYVNILPNTLRKFLEVELTKSDVRNKAMYTPLYSEFAFAAGGFPNIFERRTTKMSFHFHRVLKTVPVSQARVSFAILKRKIAIFGVEREA